MIRARTRPGFTLVELLVVLAIAVSITGLIVGVSPKQNRAQVVQMSAERVASLLRRARSMAVANNSPYAVSFNIENAPGSTGRVINNRSGGHWCRIVRAGRVDIGDSSGFFSTAPPVLEGTSHMALNLPPGVTGVPQAVTGLRWHRNYAEGARSGNFYIYPTFPHLIEEMRACWVSERLVLPAGKVRFLALGDSDEGPRLRYQAKNPIPGWDCPYGTTYPRPYFGWFDTVAKRLYPWGGYDPTLPAVTPFGTTPPGPVSTYSGLFYQGGAEGPIEGCVNPVDRTCAVDWNENGTIAGSDAVRGAEASYVIQAGGRPRPLVNGEWGDFTIVFNQDGTAVFPSMKCNRRWHLPAEGGVSDQAKSWSYYDNPGYDSVQIVPNGESIHYQRHTGRAFITLVPDSAADDDHFDSAHQALRSMLPMCRVYVTRAGYVGVTQVRWNENVLSELQAQGLGTPWPSDPGLFAMANAADRTWIEQNFRYGWLHKPTTAADAPYWSLTPRGTPITDQVSSEMLIRRIWWMSP